MTVSLFMLMPVCADCVKFSRAEFFATFVIPCSDSLARRFALKQIFEVYEYYLYRSLCCWRAIVIWPYKAFFDLMAVRPDFPVFLLKGLLSGSQRTYYSLVDFNAPP